MFEGGKFPKPSNSDNVLTMIYGDYMKFSPEEERTFCHSLGEINFGAYKK